jgi:hypothetical protein
MKQRFSPMPACALLVCSNFYFSAFYSCMPTQNLSCSVAITRARQSSIRKSREPIKVAGAEAEKFKYEHGDRCDILADEGGQWFVKFKKGAHIFVPKAFKLSCTVTGQIPTGWDAGRYSIPADIIAQTDRATLWALVCTAEALNQSGIADPYELYKHMHPSGVGTSLCRWLRESCEGVQGSSGGERGPK